LVNFVALFPFDTLYHPIFIAFSSSFSFDPFFTKSGVLTLHSVLS